MTMKGFTLVETMIAVTILTLSVVGPLFTASRAIVAAQGARDQLTASYLAQEGIEYVRLMRDNEYLAAHQAGGANVSSAAWNNFLTNPAGGADDFTISGCMATACTLDPSAPSGTGVGHALAPCAAGSCAPLHLSGYYTQQSVGTLQPFTRTIQALPTIPSSPNEEIIVSKVTWDFHGTSYSMSVTDHLTPWQ